MPGTTSPDGLVFPVVGDTAGPRVAITQLADSVQDALNNIHEGADRVVNFYGTASNIGLVTPKDGDTYQESDGAQRLWNRVGGVWVTGESGMYFIRPTLVSGTGASLATDGSVVFVTNPTQLNVDGCFSPRFRRYRILVAVDAVSAASDIYLKFRSGGAAIGAASSNWVRESVQTAGVAPTVQAGANQNEITTGRITNTGCMLNIEIQNPARATWKAVTGEGVDRAALKVSFAGFTNVSSVADGFSIGTQSATLLSGSLKIYGYA